MRTNSLPMKPAPPVTNRRTSDVLDRPVETDAWIVPGDPALVGISAAVRLGDVVVEDHVAVRNALVPVCNQRWDGHHPRRVLTEHHRLDPSGGRRIVAQVDKHDPRVALDDVPVVPLALVPVEGFDQLGRVAAAGVGEAPRHLGELLVREERPSVVIEIAPFQLLDEVATLVGPLLERLEHDAVDPAEPLGRRARSHGVQHPFHLGEQCHPCHSYWNQPSKSRIALTLPAPLYRYTSPSCASPVVSTVTTARLGTTAPTPRLRSETPGGLDRFAG